MPNKHIHIFPACFYHENWSPKSLFKILSWTVLSSCAKLAYFHFSSLENCLSPTGDFEIRLIFTLNILSACGLGNYCDYIIMHTTSSLCGVLC